MPAGTGAPGHLSLILVKLELLTFTGLISCP